MPDPVQPQPNAEEAVNQILQNIVNEHPQLAEPTRQGGLTRDYAPVNLPNDDTAQTYYRNHIPEGQPDQAQPTQTQATTTPAPGQAASDQTSGGKVFGKYNSIDEANTGYWKLVDELKARDAENRALKAVNLHLENVFGGNRQERPEPTAPQHIAVQLLPDQTPVIPADQIRQSAAREAAEVARQTVNSMLGPLQAFSGAQSRINSEYPEFNSKQAEFTQWLNLNPTYQERVAANPDTGLELAWLRYRDETARRQTVASAQTTNIAQQQVNQARQQAGAVAQNGGGGATRRTTDVHARAQRLNDLWNYGQQTGDWKPYKDFRTAEAVGESFLADLDKTRWGT